MRAPRQPRLATVGGASRWPCLHQAASTAAAHLPENAAYGLMALAPLGPLFGPQAMVLALAAAVLATAVGALLGGGGLVSGPRASLALLTAAFVAAVAGRLDATGVVATPWIVLLIVAVGLMAAGLLQVLFGALRLGGIVKYTPYPVRQGLTSGVGLLLILSALPVLLGQGFGGDMTLSSLHPLNGAAAVGLAACVAAWLTQWRRWPVPSVLVGLVVGAALHALLVAHVPGMSPSRLIGAPSFDPAWLLHLVEATADPRLGTDQVLWVMVGGFALTTAVLCSLDTLLAVSVVDGRLRRSRDASRELVSQGVANIVVGCVGGMATSPSIARSLALLQTPPDPTGRWVSPQSPEMALHQDPKKRVLSYTLALALLVVLASPLLAWLPQSALGGVLVLQGLQMVSPSLWRTLAGLWRGRHEALSNHWRMLAANWAVAAIVAANAIVLGLGPAVLIGASFAVLLFVRANMRDVVRREWSAVTRRSLKTRPAAATQALQAHGERIVLLEMEGSLFFGTADVLRERLQRLSQRAETVILDLHQVAEVDVTAARILLETAEDWQRRGLALVFAEWPDGDPRRTALQAVEGSAHHARLHLSPTTDAALEQAEDALLERLGMAHAPGVELELQDTLLGRGLDSDELALLHRQLDRVQFAPGETLFSIGDPGDALYVSVRGDIGLRVPGSARRLASFAPGVTIGEMAVLLHGTRSAQAVAETEVVALRLTSSAFDGIMAEQPALAAKILRNLTLQLANRVRVLTGDLAQWVERSAHGRSANEPAMSLVAPASEDGRD